MQLKLAQEKVSKLANADEILAKVQIEYELLAQRMTDYYAAKKLIMAIKKQSLQRSYENLDVHYKYKEIKQSLAIQKQKWLQLNQFDFLPATAE
jgi:stearoyl-CoA desaturase (delta-9 desaturase)